MLQILTYKRVNSNVFSKVYTVESTTCIYYFFKLHLYGMSGTLCKSISKARKVSIPDSVQDFEENEKTFRTTGYMY